MKTHPILFSTEMVQAIIQGRKTQTRRVVKKQPSLEKHTHIKRSMTLDGKGEEAFIYCSGNSSIVESVKCPYGQVGDVLWVRETFGQGVSGNFYYKADKNLVDQIVLDWKPSIHMPKSACRLFLEITSIRVERLQDVSEKDAIAEGIDYKYDEEIGYTYRHYLKDKFGPSSIHSFETLWRKINGEQSWDANPWVWVVEFNRVEKPENF